MNKRLKKKRRLGRRISKSKLKKKVLDLSFARTDTTISTDKEFCPKCGCTKVVEFKAELVAWGWIFGLNCSRCFTLLYVSPCDDSNEQGIRFHVLLTIIREINALDIRNKGQEVTKLLKRMGLR